MDALMAVARALWLAGAGGKTASQMSVWLPK